MSRILLYFLKKEFMLKNSVFNSVKNYFSELYFPLIKPHKIHKL